MKKTRQRAKHTVSSFSYPSEKEELMYEVSIIAARERRSISDLIVSLLEEYAKVHKEGNVTYELNKWIENSEFLATPAFFESVFKWNSYLNSINTNKELQKHEDKVKSLLRMFERRRQAIYLDKKYMNYHDNL